MSIKEHFGSKPSEKIRRNPITQLSSSWPLAVEKQKVSALMEVFSPFSQVRWLAHLTAEGVTTGDGAAASRSTRSCPC